MDSCGGRALPPKENGESTTHTDNDVTPMRMCSREIEAYEKINKVTYALTSAKLLLVRHKMQDASDVDYADTTTQKDLTV